MLPSRRVEDLFYLLAIVQIAVGAYLIWQGLQWLGYARRRMRTDPGFHAPRVAVLCPCKGVESGLERNLVALTEFNHQNYEVFFILASESDPAAAIVNRVISSSRVTAHLIVAGQPQECGEKVNNLRVVVEQLPEEFEVLVFADSDGRPGRSWLQRLTAPLDDGRIGATTTMRWLIANRGDLATALLAAWNAPIVTMLSEKGKNFCWGGGTAIRRSVFEGIGVLDEWRTSVSDDYSMTNALERAGRSIFFVPECLTVSYVETDLSGLLEFTNRQILITRVYAPKIWRAAAVTHLLYCVTVVLGLALTIGDLISERPALHIAALTFFILLLSAIRASLRVIAVTEILPGSKAQIMNQAWVNIALPAAIPFVYLINFTHSLLTRKIRWRNIRYELISSNQTRIING
ncbi:MAG TPA: glycosyltransferase family 2 protein [Candidatus Dormibacteraeota bacterium]|nr:glycosyltransferase family 2 protein [Candidatus Dormibacteraeota bacterium]